MKITSILLFLLFNSIAVGEEMNNNIVRLPSPRLTGETSLEETIYARRSIRTYKNEPLTLQHLSQVLWSAQGITNDRGYRTAPSAGALYPMEVYVVVGEVTGLPAGIYRYLPHTHSLELLQSGDKRRELSDAALQQTCVREGKISIVFSAVYERITGRYGERGIRYSYIEAGHAAQNIYLQATSLGLGTVAVGAFRDEEVKKLIRMGKGEEPLYILPLGLR